MSLRKELRSIGASPRLGVDGNVHAISLRLLDKSDTPVAMCGRKAPLWLATADEKLTCGGCIVAFGVAMKSGRSIR